MKRKSIISLLIFCMGVGMFTTSCEDMLTPDNERHSYEVGKDTLYSYWGILKSLQNVAERYVILNECRGDMISGTNHVSDSIQAILSFGTQNADMYKDGACSYLQIRDYYHIINSCNAYIDQCDKERKTGTNRYYMSKELAQVYAIRAWVYMQLVYAYGEVPFTDKPLLTTNDIENYWGNNHQMVNAENLHTVLADGLIEMYNTVEKVGEYGFPTYDNYGDKDADDKNFICNSKKAMFPIAIILGDIYLMGNQYNDAANWYFEFLNNKYGGPIQTNNYKSYVTTANGYDDPLYITNSNNCPWRETGAFSRTTESITAIPSNKGKLDGNVMTSINRLYGWTPELSAKKQENSEKDESSVTLRLNFEHELRESPAYDTLSLSQAYEYYLDMTTAGQNDIIKTLTTLGTNKKNVGDARRAWLYNASGKLFTEDVEGGEQKFGTAISKQNPGTWGFGQYYANYTTVFPMVYRKSMVWLRFAEALNRAGYPSVAFAILRDGLCKNENWYPKDDQYDTPATICYYAEYTNAAGVNVRLPHDWNDKAREISYVTAKEDSTAYKQHIASVVTDILTELTSSINSVNQDIENLDDQIDEINNALGSETDPDKIQELNDSLNHVQARQLALQTTLTTMQTLQNAMQQSNPTLQFAKASLANYIEKPTSYPQGAACYYIDKNEMQAFKSFVNSMLDGYMTGYDTQRSYNRKRDVSDYNYLPDPGKSPTTPSEENVTIGIHQRGGGILAIGETESTYDYAKLVIKKIKEQYNQTWTIEDVYSTDGDKRDMLKNAVEDIIVDEMALELAFEGTRFSDLCRIAKHRGDAGYLAKKVAMRDGKLNTSLEAHLKNEKNWYLPYNKR